MLTSMLVAFPLLERLELGGEWGKPPASWTPDTKKSSPSLKSIAFSGSCSFNLCNLIWGTVSLSRLETLTVHTDFSIRRDKRKLLQHVAPSLRHLQLTGYGPLVLVRPGEHLNLGPLTHLEHLYVNVTISLSRSTPLQWVPGLLSSVSREYVPPLKILTVAYDLGKEEKQKPVSYARYRVLTEWHHLTLADALDLAIGSPVVKGLERVNIVMHYPAERAQIAMLFPSLQARDVLRVYVGVGDDQELMWPLRDSIFDF
ncbi:hypothetical protein PUNSTDRAFT_145049 [Punctularia strigosozonata HHB-11173 SS5]|uniref:uncharacterized protein n=1 Tax=Punctularia strigosozonata (strain HHB-11173) TaxID=741275 RepID=UPI000441841D|nr:uncharacterized protein PUNSTDRAFT_145049 [Punctularia strigosozonata HHB-11173 SS5]EIN06449.1 hypothetical protein PUNSTDRAFT_145049 [Punctularia strigosozonata HHB-11173 SS5]